MGTRDEKEGAEETVRNKNKNMRHKKRGTRKSVRSTGGGHSVAQCSSQFAYSRAADSGHRHFSHTAYIQHENTPHSVHTLHTKIKDAQEHRMKDMSTISNAPAK